MKITRTKFREEMEINVEELSAMIQSKPLREHADEILRILKHKDFEIKLNPNTFGEETPKTTEATLTECINTLDKAIDKKFKEYGNSEAMMGVDLAKEGAEDESCILTAIKALNKEVDESMRPANVGVRIKRPISIHEIKARTGIVEDIKKKEREKVIKEILVILEEWGFKKWVIFRQIKELIRKEQNNV